MILGVKCNFPDVVIYKRFNGEKKHNKQWKPKYWVVNRLSSHSMVICKMSLLKWQNSQMPYTLYLSRQVSSTTGMYLAECWNICQTRFLNKNLKWTIILTLFAAISPPIVARITELGVFRSFFLYFISWWVGLENHISFVLLPTPETFGVFVRSFRWDAGGQARGARAEGE